MICNLNSKIKLTDGKGNTIDCKDAIFIMTSNLVQDEIRLSSSSLRPALEPMRNEKGEPEPEFVGELSRVRVETNFFIRKVVQPILKRHFRRFVVGYDSFDNSQGRVSWKNK